MHGLKRALERRLLEAVVVGARAEGRVDLAALRARYPNIPVIAYGAFRSDQAELLQRWQRLELAAVVVEGVDDAVVGDLVMRQAVSTRRREALDDAPRLLRLREPLQLQTWELLLRAPGRAPQTGALARRLGLSREHLSRQFAAGGAPNLKRVADLLTVLAALQLLGNPGYRPPAVARLLGFASPSHLHAVIRRITGLGLSGVRGQSEREVVGRFLRVGARSRG
jgi:AraC-like DNA-binding protein